LFEGMKMEILKKEAMFCVLKLIWLRNMLMRDPLMYRVLHVITTELETIGKSIPCMILHMEKVII
jgi:hypothetical protein